MTRGSRIARRDILALLDEHRVAGKQLHVSTSA